MNIRLQVPTSMVMLMLLVTNSAPVAAHHSFAAMDMTTTHELKGTVYKFEWTNPHCWLWVYGDELDGVPLPAEAGRPQIWGLEGTAPGELRRMDPDWSPYRLKPGDKITVVTHLFKDGRHGGGMGKITLGDGRVIGVRVFGGAPSSAPTDP